MVQAFEDLDLDNLDIGGDVTRATQLSLSDSLAPPTRADPREVVSRHFNKAKFQAAIDTGARKTERTFPCVYHEGAVV